MTKTVMVSCQLWSEILHIPSLTIIPETESLYKGTKPLLEAQSTRQSVIIKTDVSQKGNLHNSFTKIKKRNNTIRRQSDAFGLSHCSSL